MFWKGQIDTKPDTKIEPLCLRAVSTRIHPHQSYVPSARVRPDPCRWPRHALRAHVAHDAGGLGPVGGVACLRLRLRYCPPARLAAVGLRAQGASAVAARGVAAPGALVERRALEGAARRSVDLFGRLRARASEGSAPLQGCRRPPTATLPRQPPLQRIQRLGRFVDFFFKKRGGGSTNKKKKK
jgi:hypothetical protein